MIDKRFPKWDVDVENGTIFSLRYKKYVGAINPKGYILIESINPKYKHVGVHQYIWMVANGCDIPEGYDIHHKDGNRQNNSIYNLELIEKHKHRSGHRKDFKHSEETKRKISEKQKGKPIFKNRKKVGQYTLDGELIRTYSSIDEATSDGFIQSNIVRCCRCERKTHKGYIWKYL